jgi:hypothetical protein
LLNCLAIAFHLARIGLAQLYDAPRRTAFDENAREQSSADMTNLPVVEMIIGRGSMRSGKQNFGQRKRYAVLGAVEFVLRRIEFILNICENTPEAYLRQEWAATSI